VTWCGCGRVEFFEGCEQRRGECIGTPADRVPVSYRWPDRTRNPVSGNAANPMTGSGMQQARDLPSGGSRRGGVKPRGRNGIPRQAASGPNRVGSNVDSGEWTLGRHVGGGGSRHPSFAGPRRPQGLQGPLTTQVVSARTSVCRDESQERRSEFRPGRQVSTLKGAKTTGSARKFGSSGPRLRRDTVGTPRRPAGQPVRSGRERERPTTRYDDLAGDEPAISR